MGIKISNWLPKVGVKEAKDKRIICKLLAEMIGTMILVFFSCGSAHNVQSSVVRYSLTFGLTVATMAQVSPCIIPNIQWILKKILMLKHFPIISFYETNIMFTML